MLRHQLREGIVRLHFFTIKGIIRNLIIFVADTINLT